MMKLQQFFKLFINEFVYGTHLLCLGAAAIIVTVQLLLSQPIEWTYPFLIYLVAYSSYLFNRYKEMKIDVFTNPERTRHFKKYAKYTYFILGAILIVSTWLLVSIGKKYFILFYLTLFLGGISYTLYFKQLTKKIPILKNIFVALEWTLPVIFFPIYYFLSFTTSLFLIIILVFLKTFILNSYFDIKDIVVDRKEKLLTFPVLFSLRSHLKFLTFFTFIFGLLLIFGVFKEILPLFSLFLLLSIPFDLYIFEITKERKVSFSKLYFLIGSELVFWPILISIEFLLKK